MKDFEIDELLRDEDDNGEIQIGSTRHYGGFEPVTLQEIDNDGCIMRQLSRYVDALCPKLNGYVPTDALRSW
ncbi:hypothetical protein LXL04_024772 [Taraxacum kok-saghyz]